MEDKSEVWTIFFGLALCGRSCWGGATVEPEVLAAQAAKIADAGLKEFEKRSPSGG